MKPIESINYSVFFENSLQELSAFLTQKKYSKVFVLVDSNTEIQCLPTLQKALGSIEFDLIEVTPGEENKNIDFCIGIWRMLLDFGADRNSIIMKRVPNAFLPLRKIYDAKKFTSQRGNDNEKKN